MGKLFVSLLLGTALLVLGTLLFGTGPIAGFISVIGLITNPQHIADLASGKSEATGDVATAIGFVVQVVAYYLISALLVFFFGLFMPGKKKDKK